MRLNQVTVKNFKAIDTTTLELADFNVIVGTNESGKSSVLQALHWMFQSGRNRSIEANKDRTKGATLSEKDATFMPSPDYRSAGHGQDYGNKQGTAQLDLSVSADADDGTALQADMWIKSARNEGITVHVPSANPFVTALRDQSREFSSYIPGLAGIPLSEEKRSKLIVQRLAAAGDANTVLRNVLDLLRAVKVGNQNGLDIVQEYVSRVMGGFSIEVEFENDSHTRILARFQTEGMKKSDPKRFKPLELAGIGFLQVIQIFAYLVYFRPVLLLVDEPDSHLHPTAQERLVSVLAEAARRFGTQVILTTHSPSVVRALPPDARVIWMKDGKVQQNGDTEARNMMGWGLLDRRVLLLTEDTLLPMLRSLIAQWPDLERVTALWPLHGSGKLPPPDGIAALQQLFGKSLKIVIHRDRDFMMPDEVAAFAKPYEDAGMRMWITKRSDIEASWAEVATIAAHFKIPEGKAQTLLDKAKEAGCDAEKHLTELRKKRLDAVNKIDAAKKGHLPQYGEAQVLTEIEKCRAQHVVLGKTLVAAIRKAAQDCKLQGASNYGKVIPLGLLAPLAADLQGILAEASK